MCISVGEVQSGHGGTKSKEETGSLKNLPFGLLFFWRQGFARSSKLASKSWQASCPCLHPWQNSPHTAVFLTLTVCFMRENSTQEQTFKKCLQFLIIFSFLII